MTRARSAASAAAVSAAALALALAWTAPARAQDTTDLQSLLNEHVIVTASSTAQTASSAPALSTTITADDIRAFGFRSLAEAINFLSLGVITGDTLRTPDIGARGVLLQNDDGKHFLLLLNGHAINDPLYGAARFDQGAGVPIDLVDHIEVVVGPGSVLYGSSAMMGVINVITKSASDYQGLHVLAEEEIGRSHRVSAGTGFTFKLFGAPSEVTAAVEYFDQYGPTLTFPMQRFQLVGPDRSDTYGQGLPVGVWGGTVDQGYYTQAPSAQLRLRSGDFEVNLYANAYRAGIPYSSSTQNVSFNDGNSANLDRALRLDVRHQATLSTLAQLTSRVYADSFDHQARLDNQGYIGCYNSSVALCQLYDAGAARWVGLEERLTLNWLDDQSLVTLLGIDARAQMVRAKEDEVDVTTGRALGPTLGLLDQSNTIVSPYAQQTYNPAAWIDLNAGARLDVDSRYSPVVSPRGAVALRPADGTTLKLIYAQAFRAPTWSETSIANYQVGPSPNLSPETVRSTEASLEQRFGTQRVLFGVFRTWWTNLIESGPIAPDALQRLQTAGTVPYIVATLTQYTNVASIENYGWNGSWEGSLLERRLRYGANATGAFTRLAQGGTSTPPVVAPQIFGNAHVAYAAGGNWPTPGLAIYAVGARPADRAAPNGALLPDAPPLADFHGALTGPVPGVPGLSYVASADYITADHGPYTAGPNYGTRTSFLYAQAPNMPSPAFAPIDQVRVMVGLRLDTFTGHRSGAGAIP